MIPPTLRARLPGREPVEMLEVRKTHWICLLRASRTILTEIVWCTPVTSNGKTRDGSTGGGIPGNANRLIRERGQ